MTITVKVKTGRDFGTSGAWHFETKTFGNMVDYNKFLAMMEDFDALDEIDSVSFDCK